MSDNNDIKDVPYIAHEAMTARLERTIEKLWIVCIILILLLVGTNIGWIYYEAQFEEMVVTQDVDTGNGDATVTGIGDINYGTSETDSENTEP